MPIVNPNFKRFQGVGKKRRQYNLPGSNVGMAGPTRLTNAAKPDLSGLRVPEKVRGMGTPQVNRVRREVPAPVIGGQRRGGAAFRPGGQRTMRGRNYIR